MIRRALKYFLINSVTLYIVSLVISGMSFKNGLSTVVMAGIGLTVASLIVKPIINLLLLPINLITFGLFRWVGYAAALYIVTLVVPGFLFTGLSFAGFSSSLISIPAFSLTGLVAFIVFSFIISITSSLLDWLLK
jgi:putative membrane protein